MLQRTPDSWRPTRRERRSHVASLLAINGVIAIILLTLAFGVPAASEWIATAAQAEFAGIDIPTLVPTQIAQPAEHMRVVSHN